MVGGGYPGVDFDLFHRIAFPSNLSYIAGVLKITKSVDEQPDQSHSAAAIRQSAIPLLTP